jgi:hypothetical protein
VTGGSKTTIVLNPVVIESTDLVKSLTKEQRKCGIASDIEADNLLFQVSTRLHSVLVLVLVFPTDFLKFQTSTVANI